jgi:hypothetical protein
MGAVEPVKKYGVNWIELAYISDKLRARKPSYPTERLKFPDWLID